jgi:hypothetical protein
MSSVTKYPFPIPAALLPKLPAKSRDGNHYLDVCVAGKWAGILVVNGDGLCIGIYVGRTIEQWSLPFAADEIQDIRRASLWNRFLAAIPFDPYSAAVLTIILISPAAWLLASLAWPWIAIVSVLACTLAVYIMYLAPGWPFTRFPVAMLGLSQIVRGSIFLIRSLWRTG